MTLEDFAEDFAIELWPDTVDSFNVFVRMSTQWRGPGGGLDYSVLRDVMALSGIEPERFTEVFEDVRTMEDAALSQMGKDRNERQKKEESIE